jgi:dihydropteroate synthase
MKYKIRALDIKTEEEGLKEFKRIGASNTGSKIMVRKVFPLSLKIRGVSPLAANILKQEMLARGGDVVTSRSTLTGTQGETDIIIQGPLNSIKDLIAKVKQQPFGLRSLSGELKSYLNKLNENRKAKKLTIGRQKFNLDRDVLIMGILNVTPDSFYDGGFYFEKEEAYKRVETLVSEGADIIDVGGMSTRPGSLPVNVKNEIKRVIPVIEYISKNHDVLISADTYRSETALEAVAAGAHMINDISGLSMDKNMADAVSKNDVSLVIMHMKGTPENMQDNPEYENVIDEIYDYLEDKTNTAIDSGIKPGKIIVDPGIGFGKTTEHNLTIINKIREFKMLGYPVLIGVSRKSFIGNVLDLPVEERLEGSLAASVCSVIGGVDILRAHDVKETIRAVKIAKSITSKF